MSKILGIDLGTTNSVVAVYDRTKPRIVAPSPNQHLTPSVVSFLENGDRLVGEAARAMQVTNPQHTIYSIKRFMGRRHREVSSEEKLVPYEVVGSADEFVQVRAHRNRYTPQAISAIILRHLRQMAETQLGHAVDRAIITVPAHFNDSQRQATRDAGEIAGLTVERIINEPTAAALAYGMERRGDRRIVVFDFGGGTFDLSALELRAGEFKVLAAHGNTHLGGDDFDQRIIDIVAEDHLRRTRTDVRHDPVALQRLKHEAQKAKVMLSTASDTRIMLPYLSVGPHGAEHLEYSLTRDTMEAVCADLFNDIRRCCRELLDCARIRPSDVAEVVMVGGATRIPAVQRIAREVFQTESLQKSINPDEVVALGAATLAGVLQGDLHNVHLMDVTSHSLGIEVANQRTEILLPRDTPIPTSVKRRFTTPSDNQTSVPINILEGESEKVVDNRPLGLFRLTGIRRAPRGVPRIEVEFKVDTNGILSVSATDIDTGRSQAIVVTGGFGMADDEKEQLKREGEAAQKQEEKKAKAVYLQSHAERVCHDMSKWIEYNAKLMPPRSVMKIYAVLQKLRHAIARKDERGMRSSLKKLDTLSHVFRKAG